MQYFFKYTRGILAYIVVILCFAFLFTIAIVPIPKDNQPVVNTSAGVVLLTIGVVVSYYFGASKDKSDQDQSKIFPKDPPNP